MSDDDYETENARLKKRMEVVVEKVRETIIKSKEDYEKLEKTLASIRENAAKLDDDVKEKILLSNEQLAKDLGLKKD